MTPTRDQPIEEANVLKTIRYFLGMNGMAMLAACGGGESDVRGGGLVVDPGATLQFKVVDRIDFDDTIECFQPEAFASTMGQRCTRLGAETRISLDGQRVSADALKGIRRAYATMRGAIERRNFHFVSATASEIDVERVLVGPVLDVDAARGRFVAMG